MDIKGKKQVAYSEWNLPVHDLKGKFDRGELVPDPDWQRGYVWKPKDEKLLIDTIIKGMPMPKFFLTEEYRPEKGASIHYVVDGQQRLKAIYKFLNNKFSINLNGEEKFYKDLDTETQEKITTYKLNGHYMKNASQRDINFLFQRLNTTGVKLTNMEIWNNEFVGKQILQLLADIFDKHKGYYFSVLYTEDNVNRKLPLDDILDLANSIKNKGVSGGSPKILGDFLEKNKNISKVTVKLLKSYFDKTFLVLQIFLPRDILITTNYTRRTHFISLFLAIALLLDKYYMLNKPEKTRNRLIDFILNPPKAYQDSAIGGIRQKDRRKIRVNFFQKILLEDAIKLDRIRLFKPELLKKFWHGKKHICGLCGKNIMNFNDCVLDHIKPWSKGGKTTPQNAQLAHKRCNRIKRSREDKFVII